MSEKREGVDSGKHNRYVVIAGTTTAVLTLIAAIIGLVSVLADDGGSSAGSATAPITETSETGSGESPEDPSEEDVEGTLDPAHDGNSRATAKRLPASRTIYSTIAAGNDEDWYVYEAPKEETATVEVATAGEEAASRILWAVVFQGQDEIESSADVDNEIEALVLPWGVEAGTRLFVVVRDTCADLGGCSVGEYKVAVRTSPPS